MSNARKVRWAGFSRPYWVMSNDRSFNSKRGNFLSLYERYLGNRHRVGAGRIPDTPVRMLVDIGDIAFPRHKRAS